MRVPNAMFVCIVCVKQFLTGVIQIFYKAI